MASDVRCRDPQTSATCIQHKIQMIHLKRWFRMPLISFLPTGSQTDLNYFRFTRTRRTNITRCDRIPAPPRSSGSPDPPFTVRLLFPPHRIQHHQFLEGKKAYPAQTTSRGEEDCRPEADETEGRVVRNLLYGAKETTITEQARKKNVDESTIGRILRGREINTYKKQRRNFMSVTRKSERKLMCSRFRKTMRQ